MEGGDKYVVAVDQGTSSSRAILFRLKDWQVVHKEQRELGSLYPQVGWCEQDPNLILATVLQCLEGVAQHLSKMGAPTSDLVGLGITNQRETTVAWDKVTGQPLHNAIVWLDARTKDTVDTFIRDHTMEAVHAQTGLPLSTYFSAFKMKWLLENVEAVKGAHLRGTLMMGTVDTWLIWNLTGRKRYVTDVTNASRTMLMNIRTLQWDPDLCSFFGVPIEVLPEIVSSSEVFGPVSYEGCPFRPTAGGGAVPVVAGCLGDQQAALVGQHCVEPGKAKNTYGTGCFLLYNVGPEPVFSTHGLLTTVAFKFGKDSSPVYALEGSISAAGEAIKWLVKVGLVENASMSGELASQVQDSGGVFFVPAFNGLFAPYWRPDARGTLLGISQATTRNHICRAALEAVSLQTKEILDCMELDSKLELKDLLVDGGMTANRTLLQIQADILGIDVVKPKMAETTALGAAFAAALALGYWKLEDFGHPEGAVEVIKPSMGRDERDQKIASWKKAVEKSFGTAKL